MGMDGAEDTGGVVHLERWREAFYAVHTGDNLGAKKKAFQRAREDLVERGYISVADDLYSKGPEEWPV
jgi:hypothetical protein